MPGPTVSFPQQSNGAFDAVICNAIFKLKVINFLKISLTFIDFSKKKKKTKTKLKFLSLT